MVVRASLIGLLGVSMTLSMKILNKVPIISQVVSVGFMDYAV